MRYAEYLEKVACLDKQIADCLKHEARAASGHPWYLKVMPSLAARVIEDSARKRGALARRRAEIERSMFGAASLLWNADPTAFFRRTVPSSDEAVERLRAAADAAYDLQS